MNTFFFSIFFLTNKQTKSHQSELCPGGPPLPGVRVLDEAMWILGNLGGETYIF